MKVILSLFFILCFQISQIASDCDDFYSSVNMQDSWDNIKTPLHDLIQSTHVHVSYNDVWEGLKVLDADPSNSSYILTIYGRKPELYSTKGVASGWNREHLWPRSYGLGDGGMDHDDLHMLRAADWNVNAARSNLVFGSCDLINDPSCNSPAHVEAANDTSKNSQVFLPPAEMKGDIARSIFYMSYRYDGVDSDTENLKVSSCTCQYGYVMGNSTQLLDWHLEDPVSNDEILRHNLTCSMFQFNRNPFIDFPSLLEDPDVLEDLIDDTYCSNPCVSDDDDAANDDTTSTGEYDLNPGDIAVVGFNGDNPDEVYLLTLNEIKSGTKLFITDNGWCNTSTTIWRSGEGFKSMTFTGDVQRGYVIKCCDNWDSEFGSFSLSTSGDQIILFTGSMSSPHLVYALNYQSEWDDQEDCEESSSSSYEPQILKWSKSSVYLQDSSTQNGMFNLSLGLEMNPQTMMVFNGTKNDYLMALSYPIYDPTYNMSLFTFNPSNWTTSSSIRYSFSEGYGTFHVKKDPIIEQEVDDDSGDDGNGGKKDGFKDFMNQTSIQFAVGGLGIGIIVLISYVVYKKCWGIQYDKMEEDYDDGHEIGGHSSISLSHHPYSTRSHTSHFSSTNPKDQSSSTVSSSIHPLNQQQHQKVRSTSPNRTKRIGDDVYTTPTTLAMRSNESQFDTTTTNITHHQQPPHQPSTNLPKFYGMHMEEGGKRK